MGIFRRGKKDQPAKPSYEAQAEPRLTPTTTSVSLRPASPGEMESARDSVEQMMQELKVGADQQQIAAKRMSGLSQTIKKMEAGLRHMNRLETQCVKLENELQISRKKYIQKESWAKEQENKLMLLAKQHSDLRQSLELAQADIAARRERESGQKDTIAVQAAQIEGLNTELTLRDDQINALSMTNTNLVSDVNEQSQQLSKQANRITELTKSLEEVAARLDHRTKAGMSLQSEISTLRVDHNELKSKYFEKLSEVENAKYDLKTQRASLEDSLKRRDEEAFALKARIEQLNSQVRIKQNMSGHLDEEILSLRTAIESEQVSRQRIEQRLTDKTDEAVRSQAALQQTKKDYDVLSAKFERLMHDLDAVRRINHVQKQKLERYSSIAAINAVSDHSDLRGGTGAYPAARETPDYGQTPAAPNPPPSNEPAADPFDDTELTRVSIFKDQKLF
jgi:chromosome segregation ATPase